MSEEAGPSPVAIRPAGPFDLALLAELHAACFDERWDVPALASLLAMPGALAFLAAGPLGPGEGPRDEQSPGEQPPGEQPLGFVLLRAIAGEAEIISIGVRPEARRARDRPAPAGRPRSPPPLRRVRSVYSWKSPLTIGRHLACICLMTLQRWAGGPTIIERNGGGIMALVLSKPILPRAEGAVR